MKKVILAQMNRELLLTIPYDTGNNVLSHVNRVRTMAEELRNLNSAVSEQQVVMKILATLPPSYRPFLSAWQSVPPAEQTIDNLTTRLVGEEIMSIERNGGEADPVDTAFFATHTPQITNRTDQGLAATGYRGGYSRGRSGRGGVRGRGIHHNYGGRRGGQHHDSSNENQLQVMCFNCDQPGHKAFHCPEKRSEERKQARDDRFNKNRSVGKSFGAVSSSLCLVAQRPSHWLADSGATHHMTEQRSFFTTYREIPPGTWKVNGIGGVVLSALGIGTVEVTALVDGKPVFGELNEVLHVPGIGPSLFSIGCATAAGMDVYFSDTKVALSVNQNTVIVGHRIGEALYHLQISANKRDDSANAAKLKMGTVHQRFAHLNCKDIVRMKRTDAVKDLGLEDGDLSFSCEACIFGKMHRTPFPTEGHEKATEVCELVHGDVGGPTHVSTFDDFKYYSLLKDD
jgi:hypothetical protein